MAAPRLPIVSNVSGRLGDDEMRSAAYWGRHAIEPVRFARGIETLCESGCRVFVEIGPKGDLLGMAKDAIADPDRMMWLPSLRSSRSGWETMLDAAAALSTDGVRLVWKAVRRRLRAAARRAADLSVRAAAVLDRRDSRGARRSRGRRLIRSLGRKLPEVAHAPDAHVWETAISIGRLPFLRGHRVLGSAVLPYAVFVEMALAATDQVSERGSHRVTDLQLHQPVLIDDRLPTRLQAVLDRTM